MKKYSQYFQHKTLADITYYSLRENAEEELKDFIQSIHIDHFFSSLPNDWIYQEINDAFEALENDEIENITIQSDPYYTDLYKWFGNSFADEYCNEAIESGLLGEKGNIWDYIGYGQWLARDRIYRLVNDFLEEKSLVNQ